LRFRERTPFNPNLRIAPAKAPATHLISIQFTTQPGETLADLGLAAATLAVAAALPLLDRYLKTGLVPRFPTAIFATGLTILAFLSFAVGLILDTEPGRI